MASIEPGPWIYERICSWWPSCEKVIGQMDHKYVKRPSNNCALCHLLLATQVYISEEFTQEDCFQGSADQWCLFPVPATYWQSNDHTAPFDTSGIAMLAPASLSKHWGPRPADYMKQLRLSTLLVVHMEGLSSQLSPIPRPIKTVMAFEEIRKCLVSCKKNHIRCLKSPLPRMPIWLIDCKDRSLRYLSTDEKYFALSYVWGQVTVSRASGGHLPGVLPRTIEEALELTLALGYRYLWVDQFCVNQVDAAIKHDQIRSMGRVYGEADLTIVAACGDDACYGLPGVTSHPRKSSSLLVNGCVISLYPPDPIHTAKKSTWNTRGWTYQEAYLSRRILIIGEDQFAYQCGEVSHSEQHGGASHILHQLEIYETDKAQSVSRKDRKTSLSKYQRMVEQFWKRDLRFDNDANFACEAILEHMKTSWNLQLKLDLPLEEFDSVLDLELIFVFGMPSVTSRLEEGQQTLIGLQIWAISLLFEFTRAGFEVRRREMFPSWSWTGYATVKTHDGTRHIENRPPCIFWVNDQAPYSELLKSVLFQDDGGAPYTRINTSIHGTGKDVEPLGVANILVLDVYVIPSESLQIEPAGDWPSLYQRLSKMSQRREAKAELVSWVTLHDLDTTYAYQSLPDKVLEEQLRRGILALAVLRARAQALQGLME
ncbi:HET-domain-containing protein [Apiospora arundinis]